MIKKAVKSVLATKCHAEYVNKLKAQELDYSTWIRERDSEKADDESTETSDDVRVVKYNEIDSLVSDILSGKDESDIYIFVSSRGRIAPGATGIIKQFFADNPSETLLYADEDEDYDNPYFKPAWSPDTYDSAFYIGGIFAARGEVVREDVRAMTDGRTGQEGSAAATGSLGAISITHDDIFRHIAVSLGGYEKRTSAPSGSSGVFPIAHLDEVLFHRNKTADPYCKRGYGKWQQTSSELASLVSVIIPSKDHPEVLRVCLESFAKRTKAAGDAQAYELIIVDNGSSERNRAKYEALLKLEFSDTPYKYIYEPMDFNFAKMCNIGAKNASGDVYLFLNDDIEIKDGAFMSELSSLAKRSYTGAVGCKLLYPDSKMIQHAGIYNMHAGPIQKFQYTEGDEADYYDLLHGRHNVMAVTAACLFVEKAKFDEVGGFDEELAVAFNDVDLCFKLHDAGYYNVVCNDVEQYHHESLSRGDDRKDDIKAQRLDRELKMLKARHDYGERPDPYLSPYFNWNLNYYDFKFGPFAAIWEELPILTPEKFTEITADAQKNGIPDDRHDKEPGYQVIEGLHRDRCQFITVFYEKEDADSHLMCGYSVLLGSDNACYKRYLLLIPDATKDESGSSPLTPTVYRIPIDDKFLAYMTDTLPDQENVALAGFAIRIAPSFDLTGYRYGVLSIGRASNEKIYNIV